MNNTGIIIVDG